MATIVLRSPRRGHATCTIDLKTQSDMKRVQALLDRGWANVNDTPLIFGDSEPETEPIAEPEVRAVDIAIDAPEPEVEAVVTDEPVRQESPAAEFEAKTTRVKSSGRSRRSSK